MLVNPDELERTLARARKMLLGSRNSSGHWVGELSSSALSTATAVCALTIVSRGGDGQAVSADIGNLVDGGRRWLIQHQNRDGGWGDTVDSPTNVSTTTLCWAALGMDESNEDSVCALEKAKVWLQKNVGELTQRAIVKSICERYGIDRTFSAPILTMCALAGRFSEGKEAWRDIPVLPFELGIFPRSWLHRLGLPVVSYALPALIAIGQVQHQQTPTWNPLVRMLRSLARSKTLRVLTEIQPDSGGFLEAIPLTSFVVMSLVKIQHADHPVTRKAVEFLIASVREDGSWPIDTNLSVWVSTLSVKALAGGGRLEEYLSVFERKKLLRWILTKQAQSVHPHTLTAPGGWAWTDLSGGVPDADDTSGAILAIHYLLSKDGKGRIRDPEIQESTEAGIVWLLDLQNRDGGIPTFCRGWGKLSFDKSSPDLTAHTLRTWLVWREALGEDLRRRVDAAVIRSMEFLTNVQCRDGSWIPLWFGNQLEEDHCNPVYGTSNVLRVPEFPMTLPLGELQENWRFAREKAIRWLLMAQDSDGGWGGAKGLIPTIEETSLAVEALADALSRSSDLVDLERSQVEHSIGYGCNWIIKKTESGMRFDPAPIGLYFAKLWYHEQLYPVIFTVSALTQASPWILSEGATMREK